MKKKKILFVILSLYNGGAERSLVNLLNEIDFSKYEIDLLLFQKKGLFLKQVPSKVKIIDTPKDLYFLYNKPSILELFNIKNIKYIFCRYFYTSLINILYRNKKTRVKKQIRWEKYYKKVLNNLDKKYDIAIAYLENEPTRYVIDKVQSNKKIVWFHNDYNNLGLDKKYDEYYYKKADKVVTVSDECLKVLNKCFPNNKDKNIYLPNISPQKIIEELSKKKCLHQYKNNVFKIISIGRLNPQKGFDIAIESANILKENNIKFQWFVIGDGELKKSLQKQINKYELNDVFCLIGTTDNPYPYIKQADILVQSSRSEGKSMVLDEAKILNKPFVVTRYPTVYDQANENNSIIVDISAEGIANGIMQIYNDKEKLKELEKNIKKEKKNNKDIEKYYKLFDD